MQRREFLRLGALAVVAAACRAVDPQVTSSFWDQDALAELLALMASNQTAAFILAEDDRDVIAWGSPDSLDVGAIEQAVTSLLIGVAVDRGLLDLDDSVSRHAGIGWSNAKDEEAISIRHLLTMTSGLNPTLRTIAAPGTRWDYNQAAYAQLHRVLEGAFGEPIETVAAEHLFEPLEIAGASWSSGLSISAAGLASIGKLILNDGRVEDTEVVSTRYLTQATTPQELNPSYGYLWWINGPRSAPRAGLGDLVAALDEDQGLYVSKEAGIVVVRLGDRPGPEFDQEMWRLIVEATPG